MVVKFAIVISCALFAHESIKYGVHSLKTRRLSLFFSILMYVCRLYFNHSIRGRIIFLLFSPVLHDKV